MPERLSALDDRWLRGRTYRLIRSATNALTNLLHAHYLRLRGVSFPTPTQIQVDGATFSVRPHSFDTYIVSEIFRWRVYAPPTLPERAVIVDIGAHIGAFSIWAARRYPDCRVFACEPFPESYTLLEENLRLNRLEGRVTALRTSITDRKGEVLLNIDPTNTGGHSVYAPFHPGSVAIPSTTLAALLEEQGIARVDLLKIDAEGAEFPILLGAPPEVLARIDRITLEFHDRFYRQCTAEDLQTHLRGQGYRVRLVPSFLRGPLRPSGMLYAERG